MSWFTSLVIPPWVRIALKVAPYAIIAILLPALLVTRATLASSRMAAAATLDSLANRIRATTAIAEVIDLKHARAVETAHDTATREASHALKAQLADARARAAAYAARLQGASQADPGGGGGANLPGAANAPGGTDGAGAGAVVADDAAVCAENTVKAQGWGDWWKAIQAAPR